MRVNSICSPSFGGNVCIEGLKADSIKSMKSIRKIVSESNADVSIVKTKPQGNLESFDKYSVIALKPKKGQSDKVISYFGINKKTDSNELSVKLFNAVLSSIEKLNKNV